MHNRPGWRSKSRGICPRCIWHEGEGGYCPVIYFRGYLSGGGGYLS